MNTVDLAWAKETYVVEMIRSEIQDYLKSCDEPPIYSQIMKYIGNLGYAKDIINTVIQAGKGRYWKAIKIREQNNKDVFELIISSMQSDKSDCFEKPLKSAFGAALHKIEYSDNSYKQTVSKR